MRLAQVLLLNKKLIIFGALKIKCYICDFKLVHKTKNCVKIAKQYEKTIINGCCLTDFGSGVRTKKRTQRD